MRNTALFDNSWKFAIICKTDLYNASRHYGFNKHTGVKIVEVDLTLKQAYKLLLELFCETCDTYFPNWGIAVSCTRDNYSPCAFRTDSDGLRSFRYDIYDYEIVPMVSLSNDDLRLIPNMNIDEKIHSKEERESARVVDSRHS